MKPFIFRLNHEAISEKDTIAHVPVHIFPVQPQYMLHPHLQAMYNKGCKVGEVFVLKEDIKLEQAPADFNW